MFFKPKFKPAFKFMGVLGLSLSLWACSNKEKENEGLSVQLSYDSKCLNGMSDRISRWSKGLGEASDIDEDLGCVSRAIDYFLRRVRGADFNYYTHTEVYHILQKFFNSRDFNQEVVDDLLEVKTWLLGGEPRMITRDELQRLSVFLHKTRPILADLTPVAFRLFFNDRPKHMTVDMTVTEATHLRGSISKVIEYLNDAASAQQVVPIDVDRAHEVIHRVTENFDIEFVEAEQLKKYWSVINIVLGQELDSDIALTPRTKIFKYIEKAYFLAVRLKYGVLDVGWRNPINFSHLEPILEEAIPLVGEFISNQEGQVLTRDRLMTLVDIVVDVLDMQGELTPEIQELLVDRFYTRFFQVDQALDLQNYKKLKVEWDEFRNFQHNTEVFHGQRFDGSLMSLGLAQSLSPLNQSALDFLWPMLSDQEGYVLTDLHPQMVEANYGNLFKLNWQRALSRMFVLMYTDDPIRRSLLTGVTLDELKTGYTDVWKFLKALDILSDEDEDSWFRIFNEANLFVPRATPDAYLSYVEGVDYFAILFSGLEFSGHVQTEMRKVCSNDDKNCDLNWIRQTPEDFWKPMIPQFGKYLRSSTLSAGEWAEWAEGMEEMARKEARPEEFSRSQLLAVTIASQYIEVFLRKYDLNQDEWIDFKETVNSFESFKAALLSLPQIQGTAAEEDPQTLLAVYSFFLRNGRLPNEIFGQPIELYGWLKRVQRCTVVGPDGRISTASNITTCEYKSSRSKLMKILAFLSNAI